VNFLFHHALESALKRRINRWLVVAATAFWASAVFELFARQGA